MCYDYYDVSQMARSRGLIGVRGKRHVFGPYDASLILVGMTTLLERAPGSSLPRRIRAEAQGDAPVAFNDPTAIKWDVQGALMKIGIGVAQGVADITGHDYALADYEGMVEDYVLFGASARRYPGVLQDISCQRSKYATLSMLRRAAAFAWDDGDTNPRYRFVKPREYALV